MHEKASATLLKWNYFTCDQVSDVSLKIWGITSFLHGCFCYTAIHCPPNKLVQIKIVSNVSILLCSGVSHVLQGWNSNKT